MTTEFPFAERYRLAAERWVDLESAASALEESKSSVMAQRQTMMGEVPVNRAEQMVKASAFWKDYIDNMVKARREANLAKVQMEYERLRFMENQSREANSRAEMKLA